jgi:hypothetical protein
MNKLNYEDIIYYDLGQTLNSEPTMRDSSATNYIQLK